MKNRSNCSNQTDKGGMQILTYIQQPPNKMFYFFFLNRKDTQSILSHCFQLFFLLAHNLLACFSKHVLYTALILLVSVPTLLPNFSSLREWNENNAFELDIVFTSDLPIKHYLLLSSKNSEPFQKYALNNHIVSFLLYVS